MKATKLNLGCGVRFSRDQSWINVNYPGCLPLVRSVDLRCPLPFERESFEFIYSSHVLDHFDLAQVRRLLREIYSVLCSDGVLRLSVPDLTRNAENYLRSVRENRGDPLKHHWHVIELIDQMTRTEFGGEKGRFLESARSNSTIQGWLRPLLGYEMVLWLDRKDAGPPSLGARVKKLLKGMLSASPQFKDSGERHFWTFDEISLGYFLQQAGFRHVKRVTWDSSTRPAYLVENLDSENGVEYKPGSLYMEATK